jgi:hypothetical protein
MSNITSPIATYPLDGWCFSGIIAVDRLYLGGWNKVYVFIVSTSLTQPLKKVIDIATITVVMKILRVGDEILLG